MSESKYFKTKKDEYVFALLMMDGRSRSKFLGIKESMYVLDYLATEWYNNIMSVLKDGSIETDFSSDQVEESIAKLQDFYENMISTE